MLDKFGIKSDSGDRIEFNKIINESHPYIDGCEDKYYQNLADGNYDICGYWQNERYFNANLVREIFKIKKIDMPENSLVMQVRRSDFINNPSHFYCDLDWYKKALNNFQNYKLFITTDDKNWCEDNFKEYNPEMIDGDEIHHLSVVSSSKKLIISNSSFGWWGAWLSDTENVICPKVWFPGDLSWNTARKKWKKI
jgi:hypothetical protein